MPPSDGSTLSFNSRRSRNWASGSWSFIIFSRIGQAFHQCRDLLFVDHDSIQNGHAELRAAGVGKADDQHIAVIERDQVEDLFGESGVGAEVFPGVVDVARGALAAGFSAFPGEP